jgi:hypothetical protein
MPTKPTKPKNIPLGIVTATADRRRAAPCLASWKQHASKKLPIHIVENAYLGLVPAFQLGVEVFMQKYPDYEIIACLHDDLVILEQDWDLRVVDCFKTFPAVGLAGFGGWQALGSAALYDEPYAPQQLLPSDYVSNLTDAETWGARSQSIERVVVASRFSQIGRRAFWSGFHEVEWRTRLSRRKFYPRPWEAISRAGIVDHFYAGALGCLAKRGGWQVMALPVRCRHLGSQTTGDRAYQDWAAHEYDGGDRGIWEAAHRIGYDTFQDVLPLRLDT